MRKIIILSIVAAVALLSMLVGSVSFAKEEANETMSGRGSLYKSSDYKPDRYQVLNINNLWTWTRSDGISNHSPLGDNGTFFPRGTAWLIYTDGIMWGGKCYKDAALTEPAPLGQLIRVGGTNYVTGCREGHIEGTDATAEPSPPGDALIYRIRRDYASMSTEELQRDAAESNETSVSSITSAETDEIYDRYELDWENWPVDLGAPYIDRNGDGVYTAPSPFSATFTVDDLIAGGHDEPGIAGADPNSPADQVVWTVFNDLDSEQCIVLQGSHPMGMEVQITVWGYKRTDALGSIYFRRARIINKGGVDTNGDGSADGSFWVDSMYVAQWSDPDLGSAGDDLLGCDTTLSVGYVYNGNANDNEYVKFGLPPPTAGYDFLQGPIVADSGSVAVFDLKYRNDFKNLPMTSFSWFSAGSPISDPPRDYGTGTLRWYKMLRGYVPLDGPLAYYPFPAGVTPNTFPYSGDPVTQTGLLDGQGTPDSFAPGDRRLNVSTGPFTLAPGDTQEVVVAVVCGIGADRFSSISVMKFNDRFAQNTYDALFQVPSPSKAPTVVVTELDGQVVLEWGTDLARVTDIETTVNEPGGFVFEGYNVYQFPSSGASITTEGTKRIATYDLPDDPTVILDEQFDVSSGQILMMPVQFGTNSGILRFFEFDRDYVLDVDKIYNGQEYYLAVTAYSRATVSGYLPAALESSPTILTAVPKVPFGVTYYSAYNDTLAVEHVSGTSDGVVRPIVLDPTLSTGDTYEVSFVATDSTPVWKLTNITDNVVLLDNQTNQSGDDEYKFVDGLNLKVEGPPLEGNSWSAEEITGERWFSGAGDGELLYGGAYLAPNFTGSGMDPADYKTVEIRFVAKTGYTDDNGNGAYDIGEPYTMPETGTQKAWLYQTWNDEDAYRGFFDVPFTAWDVQGANPRQLNVIVRDYDDNGQWDLHDDDVSPYNYTWIADTDYDPTGVLHGPPSLGGTGWLFDQSDKPALWTLWLGQRGSREPYGADVTLTLVPNFVNTVTDVFGFSAPMPRTGSDDEEFSAEKVGVFPNPYYAYNPAERSKLARFVTFNNLPPVATIRIFNLAGQLVRKIEKDNTSQFQQWNLLNHDSLPVASGMYIAHVEVTFPDGSKDSKVLKLAIIQEQEVLDVY